VLICLLLLVAPRWSARFDTRNSVIEYTGFQHARRTLSQLPANVSKLLEMLVLAGLKQRVIAALVPLILLNQTHSRNCNTEDVANDVI
jgi:hypothetical protein